MLALFFEVYGAFCFFSLIVFLVWAAVAKLRPDLDEEEFEEIENLRKLANSQLSDNAPSSEDPIVEILSLQAPDATQFLKKVGLGRSHDEPIRELSLNRSVQPRGHLQICK